MKSSSRNILKGLNVRIYLQFESHQRLLIFINQFKMIMNPRVLHLRLGFLVVQRDELTYIDTTMLCQSILSYHLDFYEFGNIVMDI